MISIIIVGCGATGSHLITLLSQLAISEKKIDEIILIDGDIVESKNYRNQKFTSKDLGMNKAEVLSSRYNKLGIKVSFIDEYLVNKELVVNLIKNSLNDFILIGCVDNNKARIVLNDVFYDSCINSLVYIDTGNGEGDERTGQTVVGVKCENNIIHPPVCNYFPEILTSKEEVKNETYSCSEIQKHPQNFATNILSATTTFMITNNIICLNKFNKNLFVFNSDTISIL